MKNVKNLPLKIIMLVAVAVQLGVVIFLGTKLIKMNILPVKYLIIFGIIIVAFNVVAFLATRNLGFGIGMVVLSVFLTVVLVFVTSAVNKVDKTVQNVVDNGSENVTEMVIVVLNDSRVEDLTDLNQYAVGYIMDSDSEATGKVLDDIRTNAGNVRFDEFDDKFKMIDALYARTINAIVINKAYIAMIDEIEGYETFSEDVKTIYSADIKSYINIVPEHETNLDAFVVYFSGIDTFGWVGTRSRSDVNILAVVNTKTRHIQLINTPRDMAVTLPIGKGVRDKLTHAGLYGVECSMGALKTFYGGIDIDFYVKMNFSGFEEIIDNLGGIDVESKFDFTVEPIKHYTVGINHLNGIEALAFARERHAFPAGDYERGRNQMAVIKAMIKKITSADMLYNYDSVLESISGSFQTNMTAEDIYSLVRMQLSDDREWVVEDYTVTGTGTMGITYSMPGVSINITEPNMATVEEAKNKIKQVLEER
ncbi:MAG: LCP family protein [Lachnospiraceae bacterium]